MKSDTHTSEDMPTNQLVSRTKFCCAENDLVGEWCEQCCCARWVQCTMLTIVGER